MSTTNTTRTFSAMLNEYLTNDLFKEELIKRTWFLNNVEIDDNWKGGTVPVPFKAAGASSVKFGGLTASTDVAEDKLVRGSITGYKEVWGTMVFNYADIIQHDGKVKESSFLKLLPDMTEDFMEYIKTACGYALLGADNFAAAAAAGTVSAGIQVDRVERFTIGQKVHLKDGATEADFYVTNIAVDTDIVILSATRGGSAADVSAYSSAAKFYQDGVIVSGNPDNAFTSLRKSLLSAANGGSTTLHGQTKTAYPILQALNVDGSDITAANLIEKIFDAYAKARRKARGKASKIVMSFKHFGTAMKTLELVKGAYKVVPNTEKATIYGWSEIQIMSVTGELLTFVGVQEMDDDVIMFLDMGAFKFLSNGMFRKVKSPDGNEYFVSRSATTGYQYLVDIALFGELQCHKPGNCAILYGVSY